MPPERPALVIHVPHASAFIPPDVRPQFIVSDADLDAEVLKLTDWYTDDLFSLPDTVAQTLRFPVSRVVIDPERFLDDSVEPMADRGMGVVYTKTCDGAPLRASLSEADRQTLIDRLYTPHHREFEDAVARCLREHDRCLIIDAHSFPDRPLPCHLEQYGSAASPDVCIGTDKFHTSSGLAEQGRAAYEEQGYTVHMNQPFAGSIVPLRYYRHDRRVSSFMVELNRRLYMHEPTGKRLQVFASVRDQNLAALRKVIRRWESDQF